MKDEVPFLHWLGWLQRFDLERGVRWPAGDERLTSTNLLCWSRIGRVSNEKHFSLLMKELAFQVGPIRLFVSSQLDYSTSRLKQNMFFIREGRREEKNFINSIKNFKSRKDCLEQR